MGLVLVKAAYYKDLPPPKEQRGSVSEGADPSQDLKPSKGQGGLVSEGAGPSKDLPPPKEQQLADPVGISPLAKLAGELNAVIGSNTSNVASPTYSTYQAAPARAGGKGNAVRPEPSTSQPLKNSKRGYRSRGDDVRDPKSCHTQKDKRGEKEKKSKAKEGTKERTKIVPRTPLALRNPPVENDLILRSLFGSISGDEDRNEADFLTSHKPGRSIHRPRSRSR
ncbi:hypothetical protein DAPPUDRAFT_113417 [Daphnia pulex]|uniref:Uncharacterized protein n=1 Tax=Daphnia pulex TaxID=6669 RepID=E9HEY9_DAPPU|nr:hypothetical protein DAPPUDRAFT_113417 [Daphnia pulex]|eukprot:EFX69701.1 hypothetical protein DAPPUDRAFT_113417 [Daphnia pulex]